MFLLTEINYRFTRSLGRTAILVLAAAMLVASMGAYLGNLQVSQAALENLAERIPVTARVMNRQGTQADGLAIDTVYFDALATMDVRGVLCTAAGAGALGAEARAQEPFAGGDTILAAANAFSALAAVDGDALVLGEGYAPGFLSGGEALCALCEPYAQQAGVGLGDEIRLPLYVAVNTGYALRYSPIGERRLTVVALYPYREENGQRAPDMAVPVAWLRGVVEEAGEAFCYTSLSAELADPLSLTRFKEELKARGFQRINPEDTAIGACDAISMEDELFIKTAEELQANLRTYRAFQAPFFGLITVMVMLAVFLVLRGSRRDMAIASSLGEPRLRISFVHFAAAVLTQALGGCLAVGLLVARLGITWGDSLGILRTYLLCAGMGTLLALAQLMRFDTLTLLTKND